LAVSSAVQPIPFGFLIMKIWKVAVSLGILGAIVAPFASGTWKLHSRTDVWVPFTANEKANLAAYLEKTKNCQTLSARLDELEKIGSVPSVSQVADAVGCRYSLQNLSSGGEFKSYPSALKYAAANLAAALVGFLGFFLIAFFGPPITVRYWTWLHK
jgi:hypothetical protein